MNKIKKYIISLIFISLSILSFAQPANDECNNATPLTVGALCTFSTYTNLNATSSAVSDPGCANYLGGDVWFSVTVPASGHLIFDTQTGTGTLTDVGMAIYSGACGSLTLIECDDDGSDNGIYMSKIDRVGLAVGSTIYIRVWEYGNNTFGNFDICVYEPSGAGPCSSIIALNCGVTQVIVTGGSGSWNSGTCGSGTPGLEKIYSFTPTVSTSYFINVTTDGSWMTYGYIEGSCSSTGWTCIARTNTSGTYGPINMTAGVTYYFLADDEDAAGNTHQFRINCPETPGTYFHPTAGVQGTYLGSCMVNTCSGVYTDDGGAANYSNNINSIYRTFCPDAPNKCITATVNSMEIEENGLASCYDYLIVRNGPTQGSSILWAGCYDGDGTYNTLLGTYTNPFISTNTSGCLTFQFASDNVYNYAGWNITLSCSDCGTTPTNNDCISATAICGETNMNSTSPGPGVTSTCGGCNLSENYSNWYYFEITESGKMALDVKPEQFFEDYDFALYQADTCSSLGDPVRCSYAMSPIYCNNISNNAAYYISRVRINGTPSIDNTSTYNSNYHSNYLTIQSTVTIGNTYNLLVTVVCPTGGSPSGKLADVGVWIDWNKSLTFEAGEFYSTGDVNANGTSASLNITIPAGARLGQTGMRIMMNNSVIGSGWSCSSVADGEIEDYALFIDDGTHCSNSVKDSDETGVDCGGVDCVPCSETYWATNTGMSEPPTDFSEDVSGDSWVNWISVTAGERYFIMINNWSPGANGFDLVWNFSEGGTMDCALVLPIELSEFNVKCNNDITEIYWSTYTEINNDYFVILKSYNGIAYAPIDTIKGAGNSNSFLEYKYSYNELYDNVIYYKLKQIDFDGNFSYSNMTACKCGDNRNIKIIPNPVLEGKEWKIDGIIENDRVRIFDMIGKEYFDKNLKKGVYSIIINGQYVNKLIIY